VRAFTGGIVIAALVGALVACGDDSPLSVDTEVGEVTVDVRDDQLCLDGGSKGGFCGARPDGEHPVSWGTSSGSGSPTYVWGVATREVTGFDVVLSGEDPITPELHEIDGGDLDGMSVWAIRLGPAGDPLATDAPEITIENIDTT